MNKPSDPERRRIEHIKRRRAQGLTYSELAEEFEPSRSTIHRKMKDAYAKQNTEASQVDGGSGA